MLHHKGGRGGRVQTFWRYLRFQAMMFVFGIVGPIFLILYFTTAPDPSMKWAYWFGLFITAADILIALALTDATHKDDPPVDMRIALALAERRQRGLGD
jgi:hypothetical protein